MNGGSPVAGVHRGAEHLARLARGPNSRHNLLVQFYQFACVWREFELVGMEGVSDWEVVGEKHVPTGYIH